MATVYLARDLKHDRDVAIKVLRGSPEAAVDAERFHREIRVLAGLRHPFILPLHDSGDADGLLYFVMPYVDGESLRARMEREGQLPMSAALTIAHQIADALHSAHREGVVHRDVKPENILLARSGHALLADFGIARTTNAPNARAMTEAGLAIGTVSYMSPEQAMGASDVDARTDIYALGCVVFEMITGRLPFAGANALSVVAQHLSTPAPDPRTVRADTTGRIASAIMRAMAKEPAERFEHVMAFVDACAESATEPARPDTFAQTATTVAARLSVAVLPIKTIGGGDENAWFADGITEELMGALSRLEGLRVVSRTSVLSLRGQSLSLAAMGERLGVEFVLEGSVRRAGDRIRMTVTLLRVSDDAPLWAETFDRTLTDVFAVQDEITSRVVETITQSLQLGLLRGQVPVASTRNLEAYDLYLLGRHHWYQRTAAGMQRARELFEQAIALDPAYAPAHAGLADALALLATWQFANAAEIFPGAIAAARRALELDPTSSDAHASIGFVRFNWQYDWVGAAQSLRRAIELNPNNETAHRWRSGFLAGMGRSDEAMRMAERARLLDPLSVLPLMNLGIVNLLAWRFEDAANWFRAALAMQPHFERAKLFLSMVLLTYGHEEEALTIAREAHAQTKGAPMFAWGLGMAEIAAGHFERARETLAPVLSSASFPALYRGMALAALGDDSAMYAALEQAVNERSDWTYALARHPWLRPWHGEPRFQAILGRLHLPDPSGPLA
jgi:serine/threonine-protein kinase